MFRCKECGTEFDVKPDYCDCGNDTFDEIVEQVEEPVKPVAQKKEEHSLPKPEIKNPFKFEPKIEKEEIVKVSPKEEKKPKKQEPLIVFERPDLPQIKIEPISLTIFLICLILSVVIVLFVGNPDPNAKAKKEVEQQAVKTDIPNIDKIWDNTKPKAMPVIASVQEQVEEEPNVIEQPQTQSVQPAIQKVEPKQAQKAQTQKASQKQKNNAVTLPMPKGQKPVNVGQSQTKSSQAKPQTQTKTVAKPSQTAVQKPKTQTQSQTVSKANSQEMAYYKISLRNKIASKIDFTNILGDGTCVVTFKVSSSGQLTNRAFAKQSDNGMLNDEVYQAVMSTPTFKAPPTGYNGATMRLTVKIYAGQFEVSLN